MSAARKRLSGMLGCVVGLIVGLVALGTGLMRLGFMRHGASPFDLSFLHLEWVLQPEIQGWRSHMENLATVGVGLFVVVACTWGLVWALTARPPENNPP